MKSHEITMNDHSKGQFPIPGGLYNPGILAVRPGFRHLQHLGPEGKTDQEASRKQASGGWGWVYND